MNSDKEPLTDEEHQERILYIIERNEAKGRGFIARGTILNVLKDEHKDYAYTEDIYRLLEPLKKDGKIIEKKIGNEPRYIKTKG